MEFENFDQFNEQFRNGKFSLDKEIVISGLPYRLLSSSSHKFEDLVRGETPGIIVYSTGRPRTEEAKEAGMNTWLALMWLARGSTIIPVEVRPTSATSQSVRIGGKTAMTPGSGVEPGAEGRKYDEPRKRAVGEAAEPNTIGDTVRVKITNLPASSELKGKVDTGATISSLHAEKWNVDGDNVKFVCPELSPNVITVPLMDQQAVKSADGGTEYRPVIELNIKINDKVMQGVQFNLNDRGQMEFPILVGQNILEKGKFLIDPSINEEVEEVEEPDLLEESEDDIDWDTLYENLGPVELPADDVDPAEIEAVYEAMRKSNVNFSDLIRHMRTDITESLDDVKY